MTGQSKEVGTTPRPLDQSVPADSILEELERILCSRSFSNAPVQRSFLRYLVKKGMAGCGAQLKEYTLGVEVFARGDSFDPSTDTIVRVHARRLRKRLSKYYRSEGRLDPLVIEIPKGHYRPFFRPGSPDRRDSVARLIRFPGQAGGARTFPLPAPRTHLVGREEELRIVKDLLLANRVRLLTLTGTGGSGKTRLGLEVAIELRDEFPGGVYFISLASMSDSHSIAAAIAQSFALRHTGAKPREEALILHMRQPTRAPTLLVLDNFDHILSAAPLVGRLLEACPSLKVLVTSRAVLHVYGEHEHLVGPLPLPDPEQSNSPDALSRNPAVALFVERAAAVRPGFALTEEDSPIVAKICTLLDGLPLAIELAAAHISVVTTSELLERLDDRFRLLVGGPRDVPSRQRTLRATLDWSHGLLCDSERKLFRRLSVFAGGFTIEGAEAVCNARQDIESDFVSTFSAVVDKSLVHQVEGVDGQARFSILETTRQYARERLMESEELEFTRRAHAAYCIILAEEGASQLTESEGQRWLDRCNLEWENFRVALNWLVTRDDYDWIARLGWALFPFREMRDYLPEGPEWLERILDLESMAAPTEARKRMVEAAAVINDSQGDLDVTLEMANELLAISRALDDNIGIARQLNNIGIIKRNQGDYSGARHFFEDALKVSAELGDRRGVALALRNLARVARMQGEHERALTLIAAAKALRLALSTPLLADEQSELDLIREEAWRQLDPELAEVSWDRGWKMSWDEAIGFALEQLEARRKATTRN